MVNKKSVSGQTNHFSFLMFSCFFLLTINFTLVETCRNNSDAIAMCFCAGGNENYLTKNMEEISFLLESKVNDDDFVFSINTGLHLSNNFQPIVRIVNRRDG